MKEQAVTAKRVDRFYNVKIDRFSVYLQGYLLNQQIVNISYDNIKLFTYGKNEGCCQDLQISYRLHPYHPTILINKDMMVCSDVRAPMYKPRVRLFVDQTRVLRDKIVRTDVVSEGRCRLCDVSFFNEASKIEHTDSDLHQLRLQYRDKRYLSILRITLYIQVTHKVPHDELLNKFGLQ